MQYQILENKSIIKLRGSDVRKFLNSITTNLIDDNKISYHLILSPGGRLLCDFFLYSIQDSCLIEIISSLRDSLVGILKKYKMRADIIIEEADNEYIVCYSHGQIGDISFKDPRYNKLGYRSILDKEYDWKHLVATNDLYSIDKYNYSIPDGNVDMIPDKTIPLEFGIDILNGISYTKGCYPGQEVIARAKYQGVVRKKVYYLEASYNIQDVRDIMNQEGVKIGVMRSSYRNKGLCLLKGVDDIELKGYLESGQEVLLKLAPWYNG